MNRLLLIALAVLAAACGNKSTQGPAGGGAGGFDWPAATGPGAVTATAAPGNTVSGKVSYNGPAPARVGATPDCGGSVPDPNVTAGQGGTLADAVVWIEGATGAVTPGDASLTQRRCAYVPHVTAVAVGSKVVIGNDDTLLHNVHGYVGQDSWFNEATQAGASVKKTVESVKL